MWCRPPGVGVRNMGQSSLAAAQGWDLCQEVTRNVRGGKGTSIEEALPWSQEPREGGSGGDTAYNAVASKQDRGRNNTGKGPRAL